MNNKETLIKMLRGSVDQLNELSNMTECIDIYDAAGYVDTEFLMEALSCINTFMDASNMVITKISSLLAPDAPIGEKKKQADEGKKCAPTVRGATACSCSCSLALCWLHRLSMHLFLPKVR